MLRLYHAAQSSSSWRVRIALALKRVKFDSVLIDFGSGDHTAPAYLEVNPIGQVPSVEVEGVQVAQSVAILELLEELYPEPPLLPKDPVARARARMVVEIINSGIQPLHNGGLNASMRTTLRASDDQIREWKRHWLSERLAGLETLLAAGEGPFSVGAEVSLADVVLYPQLDKARAYEVAVDDYPRLASIEAALRNLPEFDGTRDPAVPSGRRP